MSSVAIPRLETHFVAFGALVLAGLLLALVLSPRKPELALIYFKTDQLEKAEQIYEDLYEQGNRSPSVVIPLGKIYTRMGRVGEAIALLEAFEAQRPDNPEVLELLAKAYQSDQRDYQYEETLQRLARLSPTPERLRDLSNLLNYHGEYQAQIKVLEALLKRQPKAAQNYMDLAQMQATVGKLGAASATLGRMVKALGVSHMDDQHIRFQVRLMLANGAYEDALLWAQDAVQSVDASESKRRQEVLNEYLRLFLQRGLKPQGLALLQGQRAMLGQSPELLSQYVELLIETDQKDLAFKELQALRAQSRLSEGLRGSLVDLALGRKLIELAVDVAARMNPERMPGWMKLSLLEAALERAQKQGDRALLEQVEARIDAAFLDEHPLLAARLALFHGRQSDAIDWLDRAAQREDLSVEQQVTLAELYLLTGEDRKAQIQLQNLAGREGVNGALIAQLAPMYLSAGEIEKGILFFDDLRRRDEDPELQFAWALLACAGGRLDQMQIWLQDEAPPIPDATLQNLYYAAADRGHHRLALVLARRIFKQTPGREARMLLANALLAADSQGNAMEVLTLLAGDRNDTALEKIRQSALLNAWAAGAPVKQEMLAYWDRELTRPDLPQADRRQMAFQMLELGEKRRAEVQFRRLARTAGPQSRDVSELLFLWGPAVEAADLDWLESRAAKASGKQQQDWYQILRNLGEEDRVIRLIQAQPRAQRSAQTRQRLLDGLAARVYANPDKVGALDKELAAQIEETDQLARLEKIARFARTQDRGEYERRAWNKVLEIDPQHKDALRFSGLAAYLAEDMQNAQEYLQRYHSLYEPDWETRYFLAEALVGQGLLQRARYEFEAAYDLLEDIAAQQALNRVQRVAHAQILYQDGRLGRALEEYADLYADYPDDSDLRADYAGLLIEQGEMNRAMQILGGQI